MKRSTTLQQRDNNNAPVECNKSQTAGKQSGTATRIAPFSIIKFCHIIIKSIGKRNYYEQILSQATATVGNSSM